MSESLEIFEVEIEQFGDLMNIHRGDDAGIVDLFAENRNCPKLSCAIRGKSLLLPRQNGEQRFQTRDFGIGFGGRPAETVFINGARGDVPKFD